MGEGAQLLKTYNIQYKPL